MTSFPSGDGSFAITPSHRDMFRDLIRTASYSANSSLENTLKDLLKQMEQSDGQRKQEPLLQEIVEAQKEKIAEFERTQLVLEAQNKELKETIEALQKVLLEQAKAINALVEKSA